MKEKTALADADQMIPQAAQKKKRNLWLWLVVVSVLTGGVFAFGYQHLAKKKSSMEYDLSQRQRIITSTRAETVENWAQNLVDRTQRLVSADIFQLFASEVDKDSGAIPLLMDEGEGAEGGDSSLSSRVPFMRTLLTDFVTDNAFLSAKIVTTSGEPYMSTESHMAPLNPLHLEYVEQVVATGFLKFAPLENTDRGMSLTFFIPILPPQHLRESTKPVAVIMVSHLVGSKVSELLAPGLFATSAQRLSLVQKSGEKFHEINFETNSRRLMRDFELNMQGELPFALRLLYSDKEQIYCSAVKVRMLDWWVMAENPASEIADTMKNESRQIYILSALVALVLVLLVISFWWRFVGREQEAIAGQFKSLLGLIREQKQLLDGINSTISDPISLVDADGRFVYVNAAFCKAVGREESDIVSLDGSAIFGFDTARRLSVPDQHVLMTSESVSVSEVLWLQSKRYYFQISKTPLIGEDNKTTVGIVSVYRDITQLVEAEQHSRRVVQQTINALVRAIEEADPFLGGHSRIMGNIATLMAKQLGLSSSDISTVEAAANLSQIGKMYVPRDILLKPGKLTEKEKAEMEKHIEHSCHVLKDIEFDLPVVAAISQMNERLDGQGYPKGLAGDEISMHARVLAVANSFAAMGRPRSYRAAIPIGEVMEILERESGSSYDLNVVEALRAVIASPAGEKIVDEAAKTKPI